MAKVVGLGHIGIYTRDLPRMVAFYRDVLGMKVTKQNWQAGMVFLSTDPQRSDHEIALMSGRPEGDWPRVIDQISMRVETLDEVREFHRRLKAAGCTIDRVVSHCSAVGCYYFDPEGNRSEVFWRSHRDCWVPTAERIDIEALTNQDILALVERQWQKLGHVGVGETLEPAMAVPAS
ncbi:MAG: VOC family protein [Chloroflexota bacterium]|nr:VOC family protein [Chloroflexota bacterium]